MHQPSLRFRAKLLLFTVLLALLAVAFVSSVNGDYAADDSYRARVAEMEEMSSDTEPSLQHWDQLALLNTSSIDLVLAPFSYVRNTPFIVTLRDDLRYLPLTRAPPVL